MSKKILGLLLILCLVFTLTSSMIFAKGFSWTQAKGKTVSLLLCKHPYTDAIVPHLSEFTKLTGIKVKPYILSEQQFWEKQKIVLSSGSSEYDVMMLGPLYIWEYKNFLEPLDKYVSNASLTDPNWDKNDFFKGLIDSNSFEGKFFIIPTMVEAFILHYRQDILQKFNLKPPVTLEEYVDTAIKLRDEMKKAGMEGITPVSVRGVKGPGTITVGYLQMMNSYGARDFDENGKCVINSKEGVYVTDLYIKLIKEAGPKDWTTTDWYDVKDGINAGKVAMAVDCNFFAAGQSDPATSQVAGKMAYAETPHGPKSSDSNTWTWGLTMNKASKQKTASWLFMQWASSKEVLLRATAKYNNFDPTRKSVWKSPAVIEKFKNMGNYYDLDQTVLAKSRLLLTPNPKVFQLLDMWSTTLQEIWLGKPTKQALDELADKVNQMNMLGKK